MVTPSRIHRPFILAHMICPACSGRFSCSRQALRRIMTEQGSDPEPLFPGDRNSIRKIVFALGIISPKLVEGSQKKRFIETVDSAFTSVSFSAREKRLAPPRWP